MKLVFLHGRSQEDKDPLLLRERWVSALRSGVAAAGLELPIDERDIVFPYYGDALRDATRSDTDALAMVRFPLWERAHEFQCEVLRECLEQAGITDQAIAEADGTTNGGARPDRRQTASGRLSASLSNEWVQRGLSLLDRYVPRASARSMESTVADVTMYLQDPDVQAHIENGVAEAFAECGSDDTVVVGHSLGSIVAYRMLREGGRIACPVKALITIGSPLGINVIRRELEPVGHPPSVGRWFNAYDERDVVALNALDHRFFPVSPAITNFAGVDNNSDNHHKIAGYLSAPTVARWIVEALDSD